jgi:hypothetical protein
VYAKGVYSVYVVQLLLPVSLAVFALITELIGVDGGASLFYCQLAPLGLLLNNVEMHLLLHATFFSTSQNPGIISDTIDTCRKYQGCSE